MKIKISELMGTALDWAVAKCEGQALLDPYDNEWEYCWNLLGDNSGDYYFPSVDWAQGGPLVEREGINTSVNYEEDDVFGEVMHRVGWKASSWNNSIPGTSGFFVWAYGDTALIAAMRCLCSAKLGDEVEIPDELLL